jgi:replicative DNA helicase
MSNQNKENFSRFGSHFQTKVLQSLLIDSKFFERIFDILELAFFDSKPHETIYKEIQTYFEKYKIPPTIENLEVSLTQLECDEVLKMQIHEIIKTIKKAAVNDTKFIKDEAIKFCRNQKMKTALYTSIDCWEKGKYDEIYKIVGDALKAGEESNIGHNYWEDFSLESRINLMKRMPVSTGLVHLDEILNGGLSKGELGVVISGPGFGKSWILCTMAKHAVQQKLKVIHYTLELYEHQVGLRYDTMFTGVPQEDIPNMSDVVKMKLKKLGIKDNLMIKFYPTKKATVNHLKLHLDKMHQTGFIPDELIIDYADLLKPAQKYDQKRFELEGIYEDLRGLAGELKIPIWTASQVNRSGANNDIISLESISESFAKAAVSDVIITLSRKMEDRIKNTGRLFVAKNRAGRDGIVIPIIMNLKNFKIETQKPFESMEELNAAISSLNSIATTETQNHNKKKYEEFKKSKGSVI